MSEGKDRSLIPFAIAGIIAFLCFTAILVMQALEYTHYDQEPSLWNKPGYAPKAVRVSVPETTEPQPESIPTESASSRRSRRAAPEAETEAKPKTEADSSEAAKPENSEEVDLSNDSGAQ